MSRPHLVPTIPLVFLPTHVEGLSVPSPELKLGAQPPSHPPRLPPRRPPTHTLQSSLSITERRLRDAVTPRGDFCHKIMSVSQPASSSQENHSQVNSGLLLSGLFYNSNLESIRMRAFLCQLLSGKNSSSASEHPRKPSARVLCVYISVLGPRVTCSPGFIPTAFKE